MRIAVQYDKLRTAVESSFALLSRCECHPRDFQVQPHEEYDQAQQERKEVVEAMRFILQYAETWAQHAADADLDGRLL